jgi:hypothetical protein
MDDVLQRIVSDLYGRLSGPLTLRLYMQPAMASLFAVRDGIRDAREGRSPFLWTVLTSAAYRRGLLKDGWRSVGNVVVLAVVLDVIYQLRVFGTVYPAELLDVVLLLAVLPYCLLRGLATRLARRWSLR